MRKDSRLSSILHVLLHMAHSDRSMTSEELATFLQTHPVVVRRTMSGLRELGYVRATKGHGGGWMLCANWQTVTLRDIYDAVGCPPVFALGHRLEEPQCLVEQAVNEALDDAFREAEALLIGRLAHVTLADLAADFSRRCRQRPQRRIAHGH